MAQSPLPPLQKREKSKGWKISRRGFLVGLGVAGTGLALGWRYGLPALRLGIAQRLDNASVPGRIKASPTAWLEIHPDNAVTLHMPKVEMGQGVFTALSQIAAEELETPWETITVVAAPSSQILDSFGTTGSSTMSSLFTPLREAAATLREMLKSRAAEIWGIDKTYAVAMNGEIFQQQNPGTKLSYGDIVGQTTEWIIPKDKPVLKSISEYQVIGQAMQRVDFPDKLRGKATYGYDVRVPGMLYGAVARPPTLNATLKKAGPGKAAEIPGVQVVIEEGFAGVVADSRSKARKAVDLLELEWTLGETFQQADLEKLITVKENQGTVIQRKGKAKANLKGNIITAEYRTPFAAHAQLEPQAALVDVQAQNVTAVVATQMQSYVRNALAKVLDRDKETIEVTAPFLGGGFGRKAGNDVAVEAARLSRATGKPVHVGWNRQEEFQNGYVRPATHSVLRAKLDNGKIIALEHQQASGAVAFGFLPGFLEWMMEADFGAWRGAPIHYDGIAHRQTTAQYTELPLRTGWWRGLGLLPNTFALESFMDELAEAAGQDALEFRLRHLGDDESGTRMQKVLQTAAEKADWGKTISGRALGIACCTDVKTVVAQVAEVSIEAGQIRVHKITCAIDPGLVINPDGVKAQTQGAIVMGLSSTLKEALTIKDSKIEATNFDTYPLLTLRETPEIEVIVLQSGSEPHGMGEPPIGPVAACVANAVFALTGQRIRQLPLRLA
jgi:isoquinoline 1-oxidoreductase subunit beta